MFFDEYDPDGFYDELIASDGEPRDGAEVLVQRINGLPPEELRRRQRAVEAALLNLGITFTVYDDREGTERIFPFDIVPRLIPASDWDVIDRGLRQRVHAINLFLDDLYHDGRVLDDGVVPEDLVLGGKAYRPECRGLTPPGGVWCHVVGTDLIRSSDDGRFYVLEDNLRNPSGVSYVLQNRSMLKRMFPRVFEASRVRPVEDYPARLLETLQEVSPRRWESPNVVVLTPGVYNAAYFEHSFLAQQMGAELVEGSDLVVDEENRVLMRTTRGFERVDVIYRRIDDDFLDPEVFRPDSMLGVPGLMRAYRAGNVALANAPGTGVADDKAVYAYVPRLIEYYLGEEPILPNVPTHLCREPDDLAHVLDHLDELVVKPVGESGGYGMLVGPHATAEERRAFRERLREHPENYIAQPMVRLSRAPTLIEDGLEGRHVDLRPFVLSGESTYVMPGGLTRVALRKGSVVVNSSQGGGSKDTWVVDPSPAGAGAARSPAAAAIPPAS